MDHKMASPNRGKRANKPHTKNKTKRKGPLKVVYITNPIKFNASASEFRSLVQELTGKDSDVPEPSSFHTSDITVLGGAGGGLEAAKVHKRQVHAVEEGRKIGHTDTVTSCDGGRVEYGSDPLTIFGSYDDNDDGGTISTPHMMDGFEGLMASSFWNEGAYNLDVGRQS
ncbi:hypothetical protein OROGR_006591 [Orobanche gracilis]